MREYITHNEYIKSENTESPISKGFSYVFINLKTKYMNLDIDIFCCYGFTVVRVA